MSNEHLILCGELSTSRPSGAIGDGIVRLATGKARGNVNLRIGDITSKMIANLPDVAKDLIEVATYVYCGDQAVRRGGVRAIDYGDRWRRHFVFEIPVRVPDAWNSSEVLAELAMTLGFLADDATYDFRFTKARRPCDFGEYLEFDAEASRKRSIDEVILFSGGIDSFCGAADEIFSERKRVALVSHRSVSKMDAWQRNLVSQIDQRCGSDVSRPFHVPVLINKSKDLAHDYNQRCRSFLYAALASVVARLFGLQRIRFFENGVVSLNLPISAQVIGGRATRTTHPKVLKGFERLFSQLFSENFCVQNPFLWKTKTELLRDLKALGLSDLCAHTVSCMHTWEMTNDKPHCGRCSQCIDRRLVVLGAGFSKHEDPPGRYQRDVLRAARKRNVDRTLVESYVRVVTEIEGIQNAVQFCTKFPEVSRLLNHVEGTADSVAEKVFRLYKRHAQQICSALDREGQACVAQMRRKTIADTSLVGITFGGGAQSKRGPDPVRRSPTTVADVPMPLDSDHVLRERLNCLKQMEREIIQALHEKRIVSMEGSAKLPSQSVLADWAGYPFDTTFKSALATVVKTRLVGNGRHHGLRGGYFLTPDGRRAAQLSFGHD